MSSWIRRLAIALALVLLLLAAAAAWLIATFDPNKYKGIAVDWMKTEYNRTLAIDGPVELSVFPRLQVRLSRLSLSEPAGGDEFAGIDDAALAIDVMPLLRGALNIDRVEAHGVRLNLLTDVEGRRNFDDLLVSKSAAPQGGGTNLSFDVSRIAVTDPRARVRDEKSGTDGELVLKELTSGRLASQVESPVKLVAQFGLKSPALKGELSGTARVTPDLATSSVRLAAMDLAFKGDAPGASDIDATLKGMLDWNGQKGALDARGLQLQVSANAAGVKFDGATLAIERFGFDPSRKAFKIGDLKLRVKGVQAGRGIEMSLDWPELDVNGDSLKGSALSGKLSMAGDLPLTASFSSGAPSGNFDDVRVPAFDLRIRSDASQRKIDASLRADLGLQPAKGVLLLAPMTLDGSVGESELSKALTLKLRGKAQASAQTASWTLAGELNGNNFDSTGQATYAGTVPNIKVQARFEKLDLNALLPADKAAPSSEPAPADTAVDLAALRRLNGAFDLRAGSFVFKQYRVADAVFDATLDAGMLRVSRLQGKAWGGSVDASAFADARASRVALKATANGVDVEALLKEVAGRDVLEGTGRVVADLDTAGRSVGELRSRLHGTAALQLRDGAIKGMNLAKSLRQAKAALSLRQDAVQKTSQVEKTDFSELAASFEIDAGVARSKDLDAKSPFLRLSGDGAIDVGKGRVDYTARATVAATSKGQDGAELAALKGLTVPVRLTGPFEAVEWKIQWSAIASDAFKAAAEDKLRARLGLKPADGSASAPKLQDAVKDAVKEKAKEQLKDKLKGLFN
jgi:AsmA protein